MANITIYMQFFGAFRKYGDDMAFQVPAGSPVSFIKEKLGGLLGGQENLVRYSVLADEKTILPDAYVVTADAKLSILPPVCGG